MKLMIRWLLVLAALSLPAGAETYCWGFLNSHPERKPIPEARGEEIQKGHMDHMRRMAAAGHLLAAGPVMTAGGARGIVVYRCESVAQAEEWSSHDPAVQNRRLVLDAYRWAGPDGIGEPIAARMKADPDTKVEMTKLPLVVLKKTSRFSLDAAMPVLMKHRQRIMSLIAEGKIRAAGPFLDESGNPSQTASMVGVEVMSAMPLDEAKALAEQDPLAKAGLVEAVVFEWFVAEDSIPKPQSK